MKFIILLIANFFLYLSLSSSLNLNTKRAKSRIYGDYGQDVTSIWSRSMAEAYRDLAGLGYAKFPQAEEQLEEIKKGVKKDTSKISLLFKILFEIQKWEHITTFRDEKDIYKYSFTIIRHLTWKKVVCAFSGTRGITQLSAEAAKSSGDAYFRDFNSKLKIMSYFQELYKGIHTEFSEALEKAKHPNIRQYIFVGHSLGGAMATVALFDSLKQGIIEKTSISPVLITYGQPRTGNYAFANEVSKMVPVIFRHINKYDIITTIPACVMDSRGDCTNEYKRAALDFSLTEEDYDKDSPDRTKSFYPWHIRGLIYNYGDYDTKPECAVHSETRDPECSGKASGAIEFHTVYYGMGFSGQVDPKENPYSNEYYTCDPDEIEEATTALKQNQKIIFGDRENTPLIGKIINTSFHKCLLFAAQDFGLIHTSKNK